jgi:hypothetical protein
MGGGPAGYVENALKAVAEPFKGITSDETVIPGLFPIQKTGVPTDSIRAAAEEFLASLNPEQRQHPLPGGHRRVAKWSNIHRPRAHASFFEMTDAQRDRALPLLESP